MRSVFLIVRYVRFGNHLTVVDPAPTPCDLDGLFSRTSSSPGEKYRCGGFDQISTSLSLCVGVEPTPTGRPLYKGSLWQLISIIKGSFEITVHIDIFVN